MTFNPVKTSLNARVKKILSKTFLFGNFGKTGLSLYIHKQNCVMCFIMK